MEPLTLTALSDGLRASWAADTCSPDDVERCPWSPENPAWGHCDITALVVNDFFGGVLVCGKVFLGDEQRGLHWWNRLPSRVEMDLTREQFRSGEKIVDPEEVARPVPYPRYRRPEYILLRERLARHLGPLPAPAAAMRDA